MFLAVALLENVKEGVPAELACLGTSPAVAFNSQLREGDFYDVARLVVGRW